MRIARSVGLDYIGLRIWSYHLWQNSFTGEWDRRAGPKANAQKRGRITREMRAEIQETVTNGDD